MCIFHVLHDRVSCYDGRKTCTGHGHPFVGFTGCSFRNAFLHTTFLHTVYHKQHIISFAHAHRIDFPITSVAALIYIILHTSPGGGSQQPK